ncbi:hypothetical protein O9929_17140 [Vibrio lentus]|nr:hypothetical protein [Vibrio lentus]
MTIHQGDPEPSQADKRIDEIAEML